MAGLSAELCAGFSAELDAGFLAEFAAGLSAELAAGCVEFFFAGCSDLVGASLEAEFCALAGALSARQAQTMASAIHAQLPSLFAPQAAMLPPSFYSRARHYPRRLRALIVSPAKAGRRIIPYSYSDCFKRAQLAGN